MLVITVSLRIHICDLLAGMNSYRHYCVINTLDDNSVINYNFNKFVNSIIEYILASVPASLLLLLPSLHSRA